MKSIKILLLHKGYSSFVRADYEILKKHFSVDLYFLNPSKKIHLFLYYHLRFFFYILFHVRKYDLIITWFGDYHAFNAGLLSKLFFIKHFIIVGGNDAVSIPEINYGVYARKDLRSKLISISYKLADAILCVDKSLIKGSNHYVDGENKVGLENFIPGISRKCFVVPTGYNSEKWSCNDEKKINQVLTVGVVDSERRAVLKGLDLIVRLADKLPDVNFIFIGIDKNIVSDNYKEKKNLILLDKMAQEDLKKYYCSSKVYAQFSLTEGLPNTLCEAMLCKCIAIGSNVNGIPTVIRDPEFILNKKDVNKAKNIILKALKTDDTVGIKNRDYIKNNYAEEMREKSFLQIIDTIFNKTKH